MDAQTYTSCCDARRLSCGVACSVNKGSVNVSPSIKPHRAGRLMKNDPGAARHFCLGRSQCGSNLELLDSALLAPSPSATVVADASPIALCTCSSADCAGRCCPLCTSCTGSFRLCSQMLAIIISASATQPSPTLSRAEPVSWWRGVQRPSSTLTGRVH